MRTIIILIASLFLLSCNKEGEDNFTTYWVSSSDNCTAIVNGSEHEIVKNNSFEHNNIAIDADFIQISFDKSIRFCIFKKNTSISSVYLVAEPDRAYTFKVIEKDILLIK